MRWGWMRMDECNEDEMDEMHATDEIDEINASDGIVG